MKTEIKYISYFDFADSKVRRNYAVACANKMESICECINEAGYNVKIISMSEVIEPQFSVFRGSTVEKRKGLKLKTFTSWGGTGLWAKRLKIIWHLLAMFCYLLCNTHKDEPVIVYHSLGYFNIIKWAKKLRRFKLILEVEEIYQDVASPKHRCLAKMEYQTFQLADSFIFPTELLNQKLNTEGKPFAIIYGTYHIEPQVVSKFNDGDIHVVYAGTFDSHKGGASAAVECFSRLPKNYHLHICGFGSETDTESIKKLIADISKETSAKISFHGLLKGRDYVELIQQCDIGLSTQNPLSDFNDTSVPSKILSYLANGLAVVTVDIPVVRHSELSPYLYLYKDPTPENIANTILSVKKEHTMSQRQIIEKLHDRFVSKIPLVLFT